MLRPSPVELSTKPNGTPKFLGAAYFLFSLILAIPVQTLAQQRTDADWDAEGQVAMNRYHDCARAKHAFEQESTIAQASPVWLDQVAQASECAGDIAAAINYYDLELKKLPDTPRLVQKIGDLRYKQEVQADNKKAQQQAALAYQRQQQADALVAQRRQQEQADREAQELVIAREKIEEDMRKLGQFLSEDFKSTWYVHNGDFDGSTNYHLKRKILRADRCSLTFFETGNPWGGQKERTVELNLAGMGASRDYNIGSDDGSYHVDFGPGTSIVQLNAASSEGWVLSNGAKQAGLQIITKNDQIADLVNELGKACGR